jgi:hypothetical protein
LSDTYATRYDGVSMRYETLTESREGIATAVSRGNVAHGRVNRRQLAIGMASLLTGVGYYLAIRPAGSVWFLPATMHLPVYIPGGVVQLTGSFPTLSHTLAFSLLSAGVVASGRRGGAVICALWLAIESAFELGQRASFSSWLILHQPDWIDRVWVRYRPRVVAQRDDGIKRQITGTPTLYIDGKRFDGMMPMEQLRVALR